MSLCDSNTDLLAKCELPFQTMTKVTMEKRLRLIFGLLTAFVSAFGLQPSTAANQTDYIAASIIWQSTSIGAGQDFNTAEEVCNVMMDRANQGSTEYHYSNPSVASWFEGGGWNWKCRVTKTKNSDQTSAVVLESWLTFHFECPAGWSLLSSTIVGGPVPSEICSKT